MHAADAGYSARNVMSSCNGFVTPSSGRSLEFEKRLISKPYVNLDVQRGNGS